MTHVVDARQRVVRCEPQQLCLLRDVAQGQDHRRLGLAGEAERHAAGDVELLADLDAAARFERAGREERRDGRAEVEIAEELLRGAIRIEQRLRRADDQQRIGNGIERRLEVVLLRHIVEHHIRVAGAFVLDAVAADIRHARHAVAPVDGIPRRTAAAREQGVDTLGVGEVDGVEQRPGCRLHELAAEGVAAVDDGLREAVDDGARLRCRAQHGPEQILGPPLRAPLLRLRQLALNCGREARHAVLEQVIRRPLAHQLHGRLLPHRTGDDDERQIPAAGLQRQQCLGGGEMWQCVVADDEIEVGRLERVTHRLAGLYAHDVRIETAPPQLEREVRGIEIAVLDEEETDGFAHA